MSQQKSAKTKVQIGCNLKGKIWTKFDPHCKWETNLFVIKMDYLYTVKVLLYFPNLKWDILIFLDIINWFFPL